MGLSGTGNIIAMRIAMAAAAVVLAAGCAHFEWQKPGASPEALERDLAGCHDDARLRARHEAPLFGRAPPAPVGMDTRGRVVTGYAGRYDTDRALLEHDLTRECMRKKGYELAPAEKRQ